jgi:hypothetical protein
MGWIGPAATGSMDETASKTLKAVADTADNSLLTVILLSTPSDVRKRAMIEKGSKGFDRLRKRKQHDMPIDRKPTYL